MRSRTWRGRVMMGAPTGPAPSSRPAASYPPGRFILHRHPLISTPSHPVPQVHSIASSLIPSCPPYLSFYPSSSCSKFCFHPAKCLHDNPLSYGNGSGSRVCDIVDGHAGYGYSSAYSAASSSQVTGPLEALPSIYTLSPSPPLTRSRCRRRLGNARAATQARWVKERLRRRRRAGGTRGRWTTHPYP